MSILYIPSSADILGIIAICFLIYLIKQNEFIQKDKSKYYLSAAYTTGTIIILEILSGYLNAYGGAGLRGFSYMVNACGFALMFILPIILAMLHNPGIFKKKWYILIPMCFGVALSVSSIWTGCVFEIDAGGAYHRGPLFVLNTILAIYSYLVLIYSHIKVARKYDSSERIYIKAIYFTIFFASAIQLLIPKIEIMWGAIAVTELLYYIFLREIQYKFDTVTCVRNRLCFEQNLTKVRPNSGLYLVAFDVNNLKYVNDTYGHADGDEYLRKSAAILKEAYRKCGIVYRIGGDEFAVIAPNCNKHKVMQAREKLLKLMYQVQKDYKMKYYIANAYSHFDLSVHKNVQACLEEADKRMYEDKKRSKRS